MISICEITEERSVEKFGPQLAPIRQVITVDDNPPVKLAVGDRLTINREDLDHLTIIHLKPKAMQKRGIKK